MSTQSPLISIPPKTTEDVDFGPSLRQIIAHTYQESPAGYADEIGQLGRCRADAVRGAGSDVTGGWSGGGRDSMLMWGGR